MTLKNECMKFMQENPEEFVNNLLKTVPGYDLAKIIDDGKTFSRTPYTIDICYEKFLEWYAPDRWLFMREIPIKIKKVTNTRCRITYTVGKVVYYARKEDGSSYNFKNCNSSYSTRYPYPGLTLMENSFEVDVTNPRYRKYINISL